MSTGIGSRLREAMRLNGMSARQLAEVLAQRGGAAVNRITLGTYLSEESSPSARLLLELAEILNVRAEWLLTGDGDAHPSTDPSDLVPLPDGGVMLPSQLKGSFNQAALMAVILRADGVARDEIEADWIRAVRRLYAYVCASAAHSIEVYAPGLGLADGLANRVQSAMRASGNADEAYRDSVQFMLLAHERLRSVAGSMLKLNQAGEILSAPTESAPETAPVRGKSVAKGHTKTGKGRKQPTSRKG